MNLKSKKGSFYEAVSDYRKFFDWVFLYASADKFIDLLIGPYGRFGLLGL